MAEDEALLPPGPPHTKALEGARAAASQALRPAWATSGAKATLYIPSPGQGENGARRQK